MKMNIMQALKGCLPKKEKQIADLTRQVAQCDSLRTVLAGRNWSTVQSILDAFKVEAVRELGTRGLVLLDWERINHRVELLDDINNAMLAILKRGDAAREILDRMSKEKDNGGRG